MRFSDPKDEKTIRLMLEETPNHVLVIAKALRAIGTDKIEIFTPEERTVLADSSKAIINRYREQDIDYRGKEYQIYARGGRIITQWFRKEPDMYIGSDYGRNFIEACNHFFSCVMFCDGAYNPKNNTLAGRPLFNPYTEDLNIAKSTNVKDSGVIVS